MAQNQTFEEQVAKLKKGKKKKQLALELLTSKHETIAFTEKLHIVQSKLNHSHDVINKLNRRSTQLTDILLMKTIGGNKHGLDYNNNEPSASNEKIVFTKAPNF